MKPLPLPSLLAVLVTAAAARADLTADEIVRRADRVRMPEGGVAVSLKITVLNDGKVEYVRGFDVLGKGSDRTLVKFTSPRSEAGKAMLLSGRDLWIYLPEVSRPVRIPLQERLVGEVANGDLARADFAGAYRARAAGSETVAGRDCHVLELTAADEAVTYGRVRYWVSKRDFHPVQADFYTAAGRHLKRGYYEDYRTVLGAERPMRLVFEDRVRTGRRSILEYASMRRADLSDRLFNKNYLGRQ